MRDISKMAELKFEAPLAQFETDEWGPVDYQSSNANAFKNSQNENFILSHKNSDTLNLNMNNLKDPSMISEDIRDELNDNEVKSPSKNKNGNNINVDLHKINLNKDNVDNLNFAEAFTGSLEDLVNTFDDKITRCFGNYEQSVEELAPVQVRSQEEIMSECQ